MSDGNHNGWRQSTDLKIEWLCKRVETLDKRLWGILVGVLLVLAKAVFDLSRGG